MFDTNSMAKEIAKYNNQVSYFKEMKKRKKKMFDEFYHDKNIEFYITENKKLFLKIRKEIVHY